MVEMREGSEEEEVEEVEEDMVDRVVGWYLLELMGRARS